jgi:hypothetical protein
MPKSIVFCKLADRDRRGDVEGQDLSVTGAAISMMVPVPMTGQLVLKMPFRN